MSIRKRVISLSRRSLHVLALLPLLVAAALPFSRADQVVQLEASSEYSRPDPFGGIVEADRGKDEKRNADEADLKAIQLRAARNGYVSFHLMVKIPQGGPYSLSVSL